MRERSIAPLQYPQMLPDVSNVQIETELKINNDKKVKLNLESVLRPYLWSLRVAGVYYLDGAGGVRAGWTSLSLTYCVLVNVLLLLHAGRMFLVIQVITNLDSLIAFGIPLIYAVYIQLVAVSMLHYCAKASGWRALFVQYKTLLESSCGPDKVPFNGRCWKYVIVAWMVVLFIVCSNVYLVFWTSIMDVMALPYKADTQAGFWMKVASMVGNGFSAIVFTLSVLHTVIMADLLGTIFKEFNVKFSEYSSQCAVHFSHILVFIKEFHQELCRLVVSADSLVSAIMGLQVTFNLMLCCAVAYSAIYNPYRLYTSIFYLMISFWLIVSLGAIFVSTAVAAWLNIQAHEAFDVLQNIKLRHVTDNLTLQMMLFVTKLNGTQIGFTTAKMFYLDKNAIMTFIGVLLTYFFLLLQFRPSQIPPVCDCTSWLSNLTLQHTPGTPSV